jgi:D-psicose/D-tagatose/L-ribulose 3-epimerase
VAAEADAILLGGSELRFGVCATVADAPAILGAGFDYIEVGASGFSGLEAEWNPTPYRGLPTEATNLFFDSRIHLFGPDRTSYLDYASRTVERAAALGVKVMVIGSGASRRAPEGEDGDVRFCEVAAEIAQIAGAFGIRIAPESLNRTETNVGNDLRCLAIGLRDNGVGYTADSYHILFEWDADGRRAALKQLFEEQIPFAPSHVHIADLPRTGVSFDDPMLTGFAGRLRELRYNGLVSLECTRGADFDFHGSLMALRALFA